MEIKDLKYFVKVYRKKNLTRSAEELFITQQALSQKISKLEEEIGGLLFNRNSRGVTPTELGVYIYPRAEKLIRQFESFVDKIDKKAKREKEKLNIGFSPGTFQILNVRDVLEHSRESLDNELEIDISEFPDVICESRVLKNCLDMAFTVNPQNHNEFKFHSLFMDNFTAVINKNHGLAKKKIIEFNDLKNEKLILLDNTFRMQLVLDKHFVNNGFEPEVYSRCSHDLNTAYDFVSLNKGIFIFVNNLTYIENYKDIVSIPIEDNDAYWEIGIITKKGINMTQQTKKFINYFLKKYNKPLV